MSANNQKMPISLVLIGAGSRGLYSYGRYCELNPDKAKIVAVAEPRDFYRTEAARLHHIPSQLQFRSWEQLLQNKKIADAAIVATQDNDHVGPGLAAMSAGYDVLLEKPIAPTEAECRALVEASEKLAKLLVVCHVLRYTPYFRKMRQLVESGELGTISGVRHIEQIGFWHFAHSYVRGNWRRMDASSSSLLAKCCHDMDILLYVLGGRCNRVTSFGSGRYFQTKNAPPQSTSNCLDCPLSESKCPYSAPKFYLSRLREGKRGWPIDVITNDITEPGIISALRSGPYGRCVYHSDNDVIDHQVVLLELSTGCTIDFTMSAFTSDSDRVTTIHGSQGELRGNGNKIEIKSFLGKPDQVFDFTSAGSTLADGHMGGDAGIMEDFITAVQDKNPAHISSAARDSLQSHLIVFAAERSRLNGRIEQVHP
jgi:predicted dehydrogenase